MLKAGAYFILTSIIIPVIAWGAIKLYDHSERISKNEQRYINIDKTLSDLKIGQNEIRSYIINSK
jgi:hypothetical protein